MSCLCASLGQILILVAVLRISWRKNKKIFPAEPFFCMSCMKCLSKCPYSKKPALPQKIPGCAPVTFNCTFHSNFHPKILVFGNLPIYRKIIQNNKSLVFWKARIVCLVLFWRRCKILFVHINICITNFG